MPEPRLSAASLDGCCVAAVAVDARLPPEDTEGLGEGALVDGSPSGVFMFWWIVLMALVGFVVAVVFVENRRGSQGQSAADDQHLNRRDPRGGGGKWSAP